MAGPYRLGKLPARHGAVKLAFADFAKKSKLPTPPKYFGHGDLVKDWGVFANDKFGDCVWAGAAHEHMIWCREAGNDVAFTDASVLAAYSAVTGFDPTNPGSDNGTDMQVAAEWRRTVGMTDAVGGVHKIGAYLKLRPGDVDQHMQALWLFGAVGVGIQFPQSAWGQFDRGDPWLVQKGAKTDGGHYIALVGRSQWINCVTWGKIQPMSRKFFSEYNDESVVYVSAERLINGKTLEGFDLPMLNDALASL